MRIQTVMSAQLFCVQLFRPIIIIIIISISISIIIIIIIGSKSAWNAMLLTLTTRVFLFYE